MVVSHTTWVAKSCWPLIPPDHRTLVSKGGNALGMLIWWYPSRVRVMVKVKVRVMAIGLGLLG